MRRSWKGLGALLVMVIGFYGQLAWAQGSAGTVSAGEAQRIIYVVQPADTLWDIAARFLNSPYYWPKIWERNSFVIDPNLIFPGDVLNLYPAGMKLAPEIETVPTPKVERIGEEIQVVKTPTGGVAKVIYKETPSVGWIEAREFEKAGKIISTLDDRPYVAQEDTVFVDVGAADGVKTGDLFSIFRVAEKIRHPITKKLLGYKIINLGELEIAQLTEGAARAKVVNSYQETRPGDYIRPYLPPLTAEVPLVASGKKLEGYIVATKRGAPTFGQGEVVYLDLGKAEGIEAGNVLEVYLPGKKVTEGKEKKQLPDLVIGKLVVIDPRENTSVALVTESMREFKIGQNIRVPNSP